MCTSLALFACGSSRTPEKLPSLVCSLMGLRSPDFDTAFRKSMALAFFTQTAIRQKEGEDRFRTVHGNKSILLDARSILVDSSVEWIVYGSVQGSPSGQARLHDNTAIEAEWLVVSNTCHTSSPTSLTKPQGHPFFQPDRIALGFRNKPRQPDVVDSLDKALQRLSLLVPGLPRAPTSGAA